MRQIYDSSVAEDWRVMITFQQLIILATWDGVVDMTPGAIARQTGIPKEIIDYGLEKLGETDEESRSPLLNGRRITLLDEHRTWGWQIVNHEYYLGNENARREYMRDYQRKRRAAEKKKDSKPDEKKKVNGKGAGTPSDPPGPDKSGEQPAPLRFKFPAQRKIPEDFCVTEYTLNWASKNKHRPNPKNYLADFKEHFTMKGTRYVDWDMTFCSWIRNSLPGGKFYSQPRGGQVQNAPNRPTESKPRAKTVSDWKQDIKHAEFMKQKLPVEQHAAWDKTIKDAEQTIRRMQTRSEASK